MLASARKLMRGECLGRFLYCEWSDALDRSDDQNLERLDVLANEVESVVEEEIMRQADAEIDRFESQLTRNESTRWRKFLSDPVCRRRRMIRREIKDLSDHFVRFQESEKYRLPFNVGDVSSETWIKTLRRHVRCANIPTCGYDRTIGTLWCAKDVYAIIETWSVADENPYYIKWVRESETPWMRMCQLKVQCDQSLDDGTARIEPDADIVNAARLHLVELKQLLRKKAK